MVVGAVHGRAHQVAGAGVHADVLLVDVFFPHGPSNQVAVGGQHEPAQLCIEGHVVHARGSEDLLIGLPYALTDGGDVVFRLLGPVGNAYAAGEVDEGDVHAGLVPQLHRQAEQDPGQGGIILVGEGVGGQEGVNAEFPRAHVGKAGEGLGDLSTGHAVLGVAGVVHYLKALPGLGKGEYAAGVEAAADLLGNLSHGAGQGVHQRQIIQVDDGAQLPGQTELIIGRIVGGEHDFLAGDAAALGEHQLRQGGAVTAAALLVQQLEDGGGGGGLHGEVFPEAGVPGKGRLQPPGVFPDTGLVVNMERRGIARRDGVQLRLGDKRCFHGQDLAFSVRHPYPGANMPYFMLRMGPCQGIYTAGGRRAIFF